MLKIKHSVIIISLIVGGCSSHSGFEKYPYKTLEQTYPENSNYNINTQWWTAYNDNDLNQIVNIAIKNNIDLAESAIRVNQALYQANLLGADLVPTFSSSLGASANKNIKTGSASTRNFNGSIGISYEIDLWQRLADSVDAQQWKYQATQQDKEETKLALINNVIDTYFNLKYLNETYQLNQQNLKNYQQIYQITNKKFAAGLISNLDVIQSQQSITATENTLNSLALQIKNQEVTLKNLLNYQPKDNFNFSTRSLLDIHLLGVDLTVPVSTIANRPDLKAKEYTLLSAFKDKQAVEKSMYPSVTLGSTLSSSSDKLRSTFNVPVLSGNINISLPFLDWNRIKWNSKISESQFNLAKLDFEKNITTALNEVDSYYFTYVNYQQNYDNIQKQYKESLKIEQYYKIRYQQGINEMIDWLNAIQAVNNNKQAIIQSKYQLLSSENKVYQAMAGKYNK